MGRKSIAAVLIAVLLSGFSFGVFAEEGATAADYTEFTPEVKVGGSVKMTIYDRVNQISRTNGQPSYDVVKSYGFTFKELILSLDGKITESIGFRFDPKFTASTGASPKLGQTVTAASSDFVFSGFGHGRAVMIFDLPWDVRMEVGQVHPIFTLEYGKELFWDDFLNGGKFACNDNAGSLHDYMGAEIYKAFQLGDLTLPVYLYIMNGNSGVIDKNNTPAGMIHIEPSFGGVTLLGSFYATRTDEKEINAWHKWAAGAMYTWETLSFRGEYTYSKNEKAAGTDAAITEGYLLKLHYKILPWLKLIAHHESVHDRFYKTNAKIGTRYITNSPGFDIAVSDAVALQFQCDIADWRTSDQKVTTIYTRPYLGMRVTF
jgi:hypothetical protein